MTDQLKSCPFCGDTEHLYPAHHFPGTGEPYAIDCVRCGFDLTPRPHLDVVALWNTRAPSPSHEAMKTALEIARSALVTLADQTSGTIGSTAKADCMAAYAAASIQNLDAALAKAEEG